MTFSAQFINHIRQGTGQNLPGFPGTIGHSDLDFDWFHVKRLTGGMGIGVEDSNRNRAAFEVVADWFGQSQDLGQADAFDGVRKFAPLFRPSDTPNTDPGRRGEVLLGQTLQQTRNLDRVRWF